MSGKLTDSGRRFGGRLRELRKRAGLTQQALGGVADVNYKFIGGIERGEENPSLSIILKLAHGLGVEPRDLFELEHVRSEKILRSAAKKMIDAAPPEDVRRFTRLLRALIV